MPQEIGCHGKRINLNADCDASFFLSRRLHHHITSGAQVSKAALKVVKLTWL